MTTRDVALWGMAAYLYLYLVATPHAVAQCGSGYVGLDLVLPQKAVAVVFTGTVESVESAGATERVTFDVDRSWKGAVKRRTTIYRPIPVTRGDTEFPIVFDRGDRKSVV